MLPSTRAVFHSTHMNDSQDTHLPKSDSAPGFRYTKAPLHQPGCCRRPASCVKVITETWITQSELSVDSKNPPTPPPQAKRQDTQTQDEHKPEFLLSLSLCCFPPHSFSCSGLCRGLQQIYDP